MSLILDSQEEARREQELLEYKAAKEEQIRIDRINGKNRRMRADKAFQGIGTVVIVVIFIILIVRYFVLY